MNSFEKSELAVTGLISFSVLSAEICLIRLYNLVSYSHFAFLIISIAMLGFGASSWIIALAVKNRPEETVKIILTGLTVSFALTSPVLTILTFSISPDWQFVFYSAGELLKFIFQIILIFLIFFQGAAVIGLLLHIHKKRITVFYGINLLGSASGSFLVIVLFSFLEPFSVPAVCFTPAAVSALILIAKNPAAKKRTVQAIVFSVLAASVLAASILPFRSSLPLDKYKDINTALRLEKSGNAELVLSGTDYQNSYSLFSSGYFHFTLFAGLNFQNIPPEQKVLYSDGNLSSVLIEKGNRSVYLNSTPQALVYSLTGSPSVLLLGEKGNTGIELAGLNNARKISAVQNSIIVHSLLEKNYSDIRYRFVRSGPRSFLERSDEKFDLIQISLAESMPSSTGGLYSLQEDPVLTVEGLSAAFRRLSPAGFITITRGIQYPPRDGLRLIAMSIKLLKDSGISDPFSHLVISRNYLALNIIISSSPITAAQTEKLTEAGKRILLDFEYYPGMTPGSPEYLNRVTGPDNKNHSWYHEFLLSYINGKENDFMDGWMYRIDPVYDDSPYFSNFFTLKSVKQLTVSLGKFWFRHSESAYLFILISLAAVSLLGIVFLLVPLFIVHGMRKSAGIPYSAYYALIGLAFMFLEIAFLNRCSVFLSDKVIGSSVVIGSLLLSSGLGSIFQKKIRLGPGLRISAAGIILAMICIIWISAGNRIIFSAVNASSFIRYAFTVTAVSVPGFFMGWFFSGGLELPWSSGKFSVPAAWMINGFFSVAASPLAQLSSVSAGYSFLFAAAAGCYLFAVLLLNFSGSALKIFRKK